MQDNRTDDDGRDELLRIAHSARWRRVSNRYARRVAEAYGGDIARALGDGDDVVAENVAAWERAQGLTPRDWHAIGAEERRDEVQDDRTNDDGPDDELPSVGHAIWAGEQRHELLGFAWAFGILCAEDQPRTYAKDDPTLEQVASMILLSEGCGDREDAIAKVETAISNLHSMIDVLHFRREEPWPAVEDPLRQQEVLLDAERSMRTDDDDDDDGGAVVPAGPIAPEE